MLFNIFIRMKLNFHKINSFFSSIHRLIIVGSEQQHRAQVNKRYYMQLVTSLNYEKQNYFKIAIYHVLKLEPNPNLVLESELK
jgi:hypothetical protein